MKLRQPVVTFSRPRLTRLGTKDHLEIGVNFDGVRQFTEAYALTVQKALLKNLPRAELIKVIRLAASELAKREEGK